MASWALCSQEAPNSLRSPHLLDCIQLWHSQDHRCSGSQEIVQARVGGRKGTGESRTPPCPNSQSAGSEIATEGQATQEPSITSQASREERKLPGKVQGAPLPPPAALPSQPVTVLHSSGLSLLSSPRATALSSSHALLLLGEHRNPKLVNLLPSGTCHQPISTEAKKRFLSASKFSLEREFHLVVRYTSKSPRFHP